MALFDPLNQATAAAAANRACSETKDHMSSSRGDPGLSLSRGRCCSFVRKSTCRRAEMKAWRRSIRSTPFVHEVLFLLVCCKDITPIDYFFGCKCLSTHERRGFRGQRRNTVTAVVRPNAAGYTMLGRVAGGRYRWMKSLTQINYQVVLLLLRGMFSEVL